MPARWSRWSGPAVGVAAGLCGAAAGALLDEPYRIGASAILAAAMAAIAFEDLRRLRVPDSWNLFAALAGLVAAWLSARSSGLGPLPEIARALLGGLLCGGAFLLLREIFFRLRKAEGLGFGDVKLAATGGIWLGWELFAVAVALSAFVALGWVALRSVRERGWRSDTRIPLAVFLAPAIWAVWYFSQAYPPP